VKVTVQASYILVHLIDVGVIQLKFCSLCNLKETSDMHEEEAIEGCGSPRDFLNAVPRQ
jgi:hypothetical protein